MKDPKVPRECDADFPKIIKNLDDINGKDKNHPRFQAMFKGSRHSITCVSKINQDYYKLPNALSELMEISTTPSNQ